MDAPKIATAATLILGLVIVGVGWHAYFDSTWNTQMRDSEATRKICKANSKCPNLSLEQYFVSISFIAMLLSLGILIGSFMVTSDSFKRIAALCSAGAGLLLFIGGITLIVSAVKVHSFYDQLVPGIRKNEFQKYDEKIAAGALSFINAIIYGAAALLGLKGNAH